MFCFAGTIVRRKGIELLINAFSELKEEKKEAKTGFMAKLIIIGDGDKTYMQELKELAGKTKSGKNIIFPGFVPKQKLCDYFSAVDVGVWPGNNSVIIMEAMACSLPIIMADLQLSHLVSYNNGYKFPPDDLEALKNCMLKTLEGKALKEMGNNSRDAVVRHYSYKSIAKRFIEIAERARNKFHKI